jgi:hypothetical protein
MAKQKEEKKSHRSDSKLAGLVVKEPGSRRTYRIKWFNPDNCDTLVAIVGGRVYGALTPDARRAVLAAVSEVLP